MRLPLIKALGVLLAGSVLTYFLGCSREMAEGVHVKSTEQLEYALVVTGSELLRGLYPDLHTEFITRTLGPLGARCVASVSIGDDREDLLEALAFAQRNASLVIVTGGLGPTDDDVTREVLSQFTGVALEEDPALLSTLEKRFATDREELRGNLRRQALTPVQGRYFPNPNGTASGLVYHSSEVVAVALPGPPSELRPMVTRDLVPYLAERFGTRPLGASLQMRFVGIGESSIDAVIHDQLDLPPDLMISSLFEAGRVDLTFSLPGHSEHERSRLRDLEAQLAEHLGEYLYTSEGISLEQHVVNLLRERNLTLGIAEVGSGGAVFSSLAQAEGAPEVLLGGIVASDDTRLLDLLTRFADTDRREDLEASPDPELLVRLTRASLEADCGLVIMSEGWGHDDSDRITIAFGDPGIGVKTRDILLRGKDRERRHRLVTAVLDALRNF